MPAPSSTSVAAALARRSAVTLAAVPDGLTGRVLGGLATDSGGRVVFVARDGQRLAEVERTIRFFSPGVEVLDFPAWDCLPYDRASPNAVIVARRMATLSAFQSPASAPQIILTTVNAILQRVPDRAFVAAGSLSLTGGALSPMEGIVNWLERNGFLRSATVREPGEYAVRGGILDLYPPGEDDPVRLDFFGDTLETIRSFDPETQRSTTTRNRIDLVPANEMLLTPESIARFRERYVSLFGAAQREDLLYQSVSE
ncbi:MAG: transcription-repair coupling factor, partial [Bauldia sp.]|nr:transcription-repair coupling factor [Bauldia sp.]